MSQPSIDSLEVALTRALSDSTRAYLHRDLAELKRYNNPVIAIDHARQGLSMIETYHYPKLEASLWRELGVAQYVKGSYDEALASFINSKTINERIGDFRELANSFNNVGLIHAVHEDHKKGIEHYQQAIALNSQAGDTVRLTNNHYNIGISYLGMDLLDSAESYFMEGIRLSAAIGRDLGIARCRMFLGEIETKRARYDTAKNHYEIAIRLLEGDNKWDRCYAFAGYANVLRLTQEWAKSEEYALASLQLAKELNAHWELQRVYKILSDIYEQKQNYPKALEMQRLHQDYADSVYNKEKLSEINRLQLVQEQLKNIELQNENLRQQANISRQEIIFVSTVVVLVLLLMLAIFTYRNYLQKKRYADRLEKIKEDIELKNSALTELNLTKDKLFSIVSHDLRGPISSLQSMFHLIQEDDISKAEFMEHVDPMSQSLDSLSFTLNNLLHWAKAQMMGATTQPVYFPVGDMIDKTLELLKNSYTMTGISVSTDIPEGLYAYADREQLYLVVRNLISNAVKFTPPNGKVRISAARMPDDQINIKVEDTGIGMTESQLNRLFTYENQLKRAGLHGESGTGLGLILSQEMMKLNHGEIKVSSEPEVGSTFMIICPGKMMVNPTPMPKF